MAEKLNIKVNLEELIFDDLVALEEYANGEKTDTKGMRDLLNRITNVDVGKIPVVHLGEVINQITESVNKAVTGEDLKN